MLLFIQRHFSLLSYSIRALVLVGSTEVKITPSMSITYRDDVDSPGLQLSEPLGID